MKNLSFEQRQRFIVKLGKALHKFGTPAYRLEKHLVNTADLLGQQAQFLITPTSLTFVMFAEDGSQESSHIERVKPGEINLAALASADQLVHDLVDAKISLGEAEKSLDVIVKGNCCYSPFTVFVAFVLTSVSFAILMLSDLSNILAAALLGVVVYALSNLAGKSRRVAHMLEPLAALIAGFLATILNSFYPEVNVPLTTLSAIILFIPGLSLTLGLSEIAERDLISGTARVMDSSMSLFKLYFGSHLGMVLGRLIFTASAPISVELIHPNFVWVGIVLISLGLAVVFNTRPKDIVWGLSAGLLAYFFSRVGNYFVGEELSPFVGALAVGIYANMYSRLQKAPASIALLQGIVVLVPGSKTYISLSTQVSGQSMIMNPTMGHQVFLIFMSIVAGITFASLIVPPERSL